MINKSSEIIIGERGIENFTPLRRAYDGKTKFGPNFIDNEKKPINDFELNLSEELNNSVDTLFIIEYNKYKNNYVLRPNYFGEEQDGNIFVKLEQDLPIKRKLNFSLGDVHFSVDPKEKSIINIEINLEDDERQSFFFGESNKCVKIGRGKTCDINLKSLAYSRFQTTLFYNQKAECWYIRDGYEKESMNGTWLYIGFDWEINNNSKFRIGQNLLEVFFL